MIYLTHSPAETQKIAAGLAAQLRGGEVLLLDGDLGAGKTTFVQGLARALGSKDAVRSPTFTLMNVYDAAGSIKKIIHLDFYRLNATNLDDLGLDEWFGRTDTVIVAEWPPAGINWPAARLFRINLSIISETDRQVAINP